EIYDFLRLLWARTGTTHCRNCGHVVKADTVQEVVDGTIVSPEAQVVDSVTVAFPLPGTGPRVDVDISAQLRAAGFVRVQVDGDVMRLDAADAESRIRAAREVLILVDRISASPANRGRLTDAVSTAFSEGDGVALIITDGGHSRRFSEQPACSNCGRPAPV